MKVLSNDERLVLHAIAAKPVRCNWWLIGNEVIGSMAEPGMFSEVFTVLMAQGLITERTVPNEKLAHLAITPKGKELLSKYVK